MVRLVVALGLLLIVAIPVYDATTLAAPAPLATVRYIDHGLSVTAPGRPARAATIRMPLYAGYLLQTRTGQRASIAFQDGTTLHLNQTTDVVLTNPHLIQVKGGEVDQIVEPGTNHLVQTATAVAGARGTNYDVAVAGGVTTVVVVHGAVTVDNSQGSALIKTNQETTVSTNQAPTAPRVVDAATVVTWTDGLPAPDLGENIALDANGGQVVFVSSQADAAHDVHYVNDARLDRGWESADGQTTNQRMVFGFLGTKSYRIENIILDPAATQGDPASMDLKDFVIRVSRSGTAEADFTTVLHATAQQKDVLQGFRLPVPVVARYVEVTAASNYGGPRIAIAEIEVVATAVAFNEPFGIAVDAQGDIYVSDTQNDRIMKLSSTGLPLAVWGTKGTGPRQFRSPLGVAVGPNGTVYVTDFANHRVQGFSPTGQALATWGRASPGPDQLFGPNAVAVDRNGNVYVSSSPGGILKIGVHGALTTIPLDYRTLGRIDAIAVDRHGYLYVSDIYWHVDKLSPTGRILARWGGHGLLQQPLGLVVNAQNNIDVADDLHDRIVEFSPAGKIRATWRSPPDAGPIFDPRGVALDNHGTLYVVDSYNNRIDTFAGKDRAFASYGRFGTIPQVLGHPEYLTTDAAGNVYVTDGANYRVQARSPSGQVLSVFGKRGSHPGEFAYAGGIVGDSHGNLYVADLSRVQKFSPSGTLLATWRWASPVALLGMARDRQGNVYVCTRFPSQIVKLSATGQRLATIGKSGHGPGELDQPVDVAVDAQGNLYVADLVNGRVDKLSPTGRPLAILALGTWPRGVAVDREGDVYVTDEKGDQVIKFSPTGRVRARWATLGLQIPAGIALDAKGDIYVAEDSGERIDKLSPTGQVLAIWY